MSLDVYLEGETYEEKCTCPNCCHEHTREATECFYSANITHNLNQMAEAAGIYQALWRPEELRITKARQLINPLSAGLERLKRCPEDFKKYNPSNGWGDYDGLVEFVEEYLKACKERPYGTVRISR
jgi:hypothetical protein